MGPPDPGRFLARTNWRSVIRLAVMLMAGTGAWWAAGSFLLAPRPRLIGPPPAELAGEVVRFESPSGARLVAWMLAPENPNAVVVLLHGYRDNRLSMKPTARLLVERGYVVLSVDLQAHGESSGERISLGHLESRDAIAAVAYARSRFPGRRVGGVGRSLGGAAFVLAGASLDVDALVLESVFPTIEEALDNRIAMGLGPLSALLTPIMLLQVEPRLGIPPAVLRPIDRVAEISAPLLVVSGTADRRTTEAETRRLFDAAREPKQLWLVDGAAHVDLSKHDPAGYRERVLGFLDGRLLVRGDAGGEGLEGH